jgi:hypothetical protein
MSVPIKGPLRRRYDKVADSVLLDFGRTDESSAEETSTIVWWTKSTGQVVRNGILLKEFSTQMDLVKWLEKMYATIKSS